MIDIATINGIATGDIATVNGVDKSNIDSVNGMTIPAEPSEYTGPLDIVSGAVVAYGQRALSAAKRGSALYTVRESSGDTTQSFNSDATTGDAPVSSINTFLNGANGFVTLWNDQSGGNIDVIQNTASMQPQWLASTTNNRPGFQFVNLSNSQLCSSLNTTFPNGEATLFCVMKLDNNDNPMIFAVMNADQYEYVECYLGSAFIAEETVNTILVQTAGGDPWCVCGASFVATGIEDYCVIDACWRYGLRSLLLNSVSKATTVITDDVGTPPSVSHTIQIGTDYAGDAGYTPQAKIVELILYDGILSDINRLAIRQNIATYYGITL